MNNKCYKTLYMYNVFIKKKIHVYIFVILCTA